MSRRNLIVTGGINHPFERSSAALAEVLSEIGIASEITDDVEGGFAAVGRGEFDLVSVNALRWRMLDDEKYRPHRARWAFEISAAGASAVERFVREGGALLGLHTACICFDTWPAWRQLLGGRWEWGRSYHPPLGPLVIEPGEHPLVQGLGTLCLEDEIYHHLAVEPETETILRAEGEDGPQPIVWRTRPNAGRSAFDALGHDAASILHPAHRRLIQRLVAWLLEDPCAP